MRVKTSPNPSISLPPSTPPRFGPRRAPLWAFALLTASFAGDLQAQGIALSATKYGEDYAVSGSLWLGVQPSLYGQVSYSTSPWVSDHYVFSNYVDDRRGRGRGHAWGHYKKRDCRDLFWDPWAWSWAGCGPYWRSAYGYHRHGWVPVWAPYPIYAVPVYPKSRPYYAYRDYDDDYYYDYDDDYYDDDYYDDDYYEDDYYGDYGDYAYRDYDDGWSVDVHVSIGLGHSGYYPSRWYPRYVTRGPVYVDPWYDPWPSRHTIVFVDPGPRWVVTTPPRYVRAEPSPRIGSGGWVSQVGFKESPLGNAPARTAVARPAREASGMSRQVAGAGAPFASPSPSRAGSAEPRVAPERVADTPSLDARTNDARPSRATAAAPSRTPAAAPSRAEPEPTRARGGVETPRDGGPSADVRAPRPSSGRVLTAPSASVERRRPEPSAASSRAPVRAEPQRAEPQRAEPQRAEPRGRSQVQARPEPQARVETRERAVPQVRAEPRARNDRQSQVRAEPRGRSDRQSQVLAEPRVAEPRAPGRSEARAAVRAEPRAQAAPRTRDADLGARVAPSRESRAPRPQAAPSREPRAGAPQASPQRDARSVRPQAAPSAAREPRVSRPSQGGGSSGAAPSGARGRASR